MVAVFNKWFLAFLMLAPVSLPDTPAHPLHLGVVELAHNAEEKSLEITVKLFTDDFEHVLQKALNVDVDLINPVDREAARKAVEAYVKKHLQVVVNGKAAAMECIGFERDFEATYSYFQASGIAEAQKWEIQNTLMYDLFDDQSNIIHVMVNGKRKSSKLKYPEKKVVVEM
jgi:hypothetical protein